MTANPEQDPELAILTSGSDEGPTSESPRGAFGVVRTILDHYAFRILVATHERECTAFELSRWLGIPIVACYRRLRSLEVLGLIAPSRVTMSSAGHPIRLFRSHVRSARVVFEDGRLYAQIELAPPESAGEPEARLEETLDRGPVKRKRSRAPRDLRYPGAALELVAHGGEGALDPGEAGR
ncbi:MAG TPA: hypothetical protein VEY12_04045 [Thermoplasmata archaeon]|nr:hypothetical protein [Thermoplasmata archaeon]